MDELKWHTYQNIGFQREGQKKVIKHYKITQMQFMSPLNGITKVYYLKIKNLGMEKQELQYGLMWWLNFNLNHISCCIYMVHSFKAFQNIYKYCAFIEWFEWFTVVNELIMITLCIYSAICCRWCNSGHFIFLIFLNEQLVEVKHLKNKSPSVFHN